MKFKFLTSSNKIYSKLFFYSVVSVIASIITGSMILYASFRNVQLSFIYSFSKDSLSQVSYSADFMLNSSRMLASEIYSDKDISKLLNYSEPEMADIVTAFQRLSSYSATLPFVHSIYIYNSSIDTFYTTLSSVGIKSISNFFDYEVIHNLKNNKRDTVFTLIPRKLELPDSHESLKRFSNVYTFISYDTTNINDKFCNAVIINVSAEWMRDVINSLDPDTSIDISIIDNNGNVVSSSDNNIIMTDISSNIYVKDILKTTIPSGFFIKDVNGVKSLVTFVSSKNLDWKFLRIMPYSKILKQLDNMTIKTIIICVLILIIGIILSFLSSKKMYKPIDDILEKMKVLAIEKRRNSQQLKNNFLSGILLGNVKHSPEEMKKAFDDYEIKVRCESLQLLVMFKIDHYSEFCNKYNYNDRSILKYGISNIISEICSPFFANEIVDLNEDHLVLLLNAHYPFDAEAHESFEHMINNIQDSVEKSLEISLSCTVSNSSCSYDSLCYLYDETLELSYYRLFFGHRCLIYAGKVIENISDKEFTYPLNKEKLIMDALVLGKIKEARSIYDDIITYIRQYQYQIIISTLLHLAFSINVAVDTIRKNNDLAVLFNFQTLINDINKMETLNDINLQFYKLFDYLENKLEEKKSNKYDDLIKRVIRIINSSYMDENLCLEIIAGSIKMSPVYLGRLFKKHTAKSVSDFINEVRLEKVLDLLKSTTEPISDILKQTGFSNSNYFYTMFKKIHGITPNEYRQKSLDK